MVWRWTARRLAVSAFVVFHLTAILVWNLPSCPLKEWLGPTLRPYMLPLGLWQSWWMFAPDPMGTTATLEAEVVDAKGMHHLYEFPKVADLPLWRKLPRFRHPKLTSNLMLDEFTTHREFTARHAVRRLDLDETAFPVHVSLNCRLKPPPPAGQSFSDPLAPRLARTLGSYDFKTLSEVRP